MWWNREKKKRKPKFETPEVDWEFEYRRMYHGVQDKLSQLDFLISRDLALIRDERASMTIIETHNEIRKYMQFLGVMYKREE